MEGEHQAQGEKSEYSSMLNKALDTSHRFETEKQPFDHTYSHHDIIQKHETLKFLPKAIEMITKLYHDLKRPLAIADFCCGWGEHTFELLKGLENNKVEVSHIVGFDISDQYLEKAKHFANDKLTFKKCNLETHFNEEKTFDVILIFHGLQWMNDLDRAVEAAALAIKPNGLLITLTFIECRSFFKARYDFMIHSKWKTHFDPKEFHLYPFHFEPMSYLKSFDRFFITHQSIKDTSNFEYSKAELAKVFESFFSEVRHLEKGQPTEEKQEEIIAEYLNEFIDYVHGDLKGCLSHNGEKYVFSPIMHFYEGVRREQD